MPIRSSRGCAATARQSRGRAPLSAGSAGCPCRRPASRTQFQYTLQDADIEQLNEWAPKILAKLKTLPELRDVATDQQTEGLTLTLKSTATRPRAMGSPPQADRRHALRRLRPAPDRAVFHPAEQLPRDHGGTAVAAGRSRDARQDLHALADDQGAGAAGRVRQMDHASDPAVVDQPSGPVPGDHHQLQSGAGHRAWGRPPKRSTRPKPNCNVPASINTTFQGNAQAFQDSLSTVPLLILAALIVVYLILGILYESYIHPMTILSTLPSAGVGALADADAVSISISVSSL